MMNQRVYYFLYLDLSYFYRIKALSFSTADYFQLIVYVKTKTCVYTGKINKKTSAKLSRPSNPSLGEWKGISFIFVLYP